MSQNKSTATILQHPENSEDSDGTNETAGNTPSPAVIRTVNHVMSSDTQSGILDAFIGYLAAHDPTWRHVISREPIEDAPVYHYHRPHLERSLARTSVVTVHHDLEDTDPWLGSERFISRYREARTIVCLNSCQQEFLRARGFRNVVMIPHGYNDRVFADVHQHPFDPQRKLWLGFVSKRYGRRVKGEAYLEELLKRLHPSRFAFLMIGEGRMTEAFRARRLGFEVRLYERLPYRLFAEAYRRIDVLLMTSRFEGGPANIPEALASATPILSTRVGMARDWLKPGENGFFLSGNADEDAQLLCDLANDINGTLRRLFEGARRLVRDVPTWSVVADRYHAVYRALLPLHTS